MGSDDDIAAALPRPPLPAPARRAAAIEAAMRRFDGVDALPPEPAAAGRGPDAIPWWRRPALTYAGAFASIALVALIALPLAWTPLDHPRQGGDVRPGPVGEAVRPEAEIAAADATPAGPAPGPPSPGQSEAARAPRTLAATDAARDAAPVELAEAAPPPAPPGQAETIGGAGRSAARSGETQLAGPARPPESNIVVTGSRIGKPGLAAPASEARAAESPDVAGAKSSYAGPAGRGDWNACTIDDPGRSLAACRHLVDPAAKGAAGRAAALVADGLESAWRADPRLRSGRSTGPSRSLRAPHWPI